MGLFLLPHFGLKTVFNNLSCGAVKDEHYRLFAVDLLGFGISPKPSDSLYTLSDHVEMIENSVISPYQLGVFPFGGAFHGLHYCCGLSCKALQVCQICHSCCTCESDKNLPSALFQVDSETCYNFQSALICFISH